MNIKDVVRHLGLTSSVLGLYNLKINQKFKFVHTKKLTLLNKTQSRRAQFESICYVNTDTQWSLFLTISQIFWHIRQIGWIDFGVFVVFSEELLATIFAVWVPCLWFPSFSCFFYKKNFAFQTKYIPSMILAVKNLGNSHHASVVGVLFNSTASWEWDF